MTMLSHLSFAHRRIIVRVLKQFSSPELGYPIALILLSASLVATFLAESGVAIGIVGIAGVVAFLWLLACLRKQTSELSRQQHELTQQRELIERQAKELSTMARLSLVDKLQAMRCDIHEGFTDRDGPLDVAQQLELLLDLGESRKGIAESIFMRNDAGAMVTEFEEHESSMRQLQNYLVDVSAMINLYCSMNNEVTEPQGKTPEEWILNSGTQLANVPYLGGELEVAMQVAQKVIACENHPHLLKLQLACSAALVKNGLKEQLDQELLQRAEQKNIELPPIVLELLASTSAEPA